MSAIRTGGISAAVRPIAKTIDYYLHSWQEYIAEPGALTEHSGMELFDPRPEPGVRYLRDEEVRLVVEHASVAGHLTVPENARGVVVFAHGSGSSRHSPRTRYVAQVLNATGFGTLLFDLLTVDEECNRANVFDIGLLASRLVGVTMWLADQADTATLPIGYFGASPGTGAALSAAADPRVHVKAIV